MVRSSTSDTISMSLHLVGTEFLFYERHDASYLYCDSRGSVPATISVACFGQEARDDASAGPPTASESGQSENHPLDHITERGLEELRREGQKARNADLSRMWIGSDFETSQNPGLVSSRRTCRWLICSHWASGCCQTFGWPGYEKQ